MKELKYWETRLDTDKPYKLEDVVNKSFGVFSLTQWSNHDHFYCDKEIPKGWFICDGDKLLSYLDENGILLQRYYPKRFNWKRLNMALNDWYADLKEKKRVSDIFDC